MNPTRRIVFENDEANSDGVRVTFPMSQKLPVMVVVGFALYALALVLPAYQDLNGRNVVSGFATLPAVPLAVYILVTDFFTIVTAGPLAFLLNVALPLSNIVLWIGVPLALNRSAFGRFVTVLMFLCAVVNVMPAFVVRLPIGQKVTLRFQTGKDGSVTATLTGELDQAATTLTGVWHLSAPENRDGKFEAKKQ